AGQVTSFAPRTSLARSTTGSFAFWNPAAAFDGSGNIVVAWALSDGATNEVDQSQAQVSDGIFTSPAPVATAVGGISWTDIGSLASGQIVLVYTTGSSTQQAWGALRPNGPKGTAFGAAMQISAISGSTITQSGLVLATQGNDAFVDW